MEWKAGHPRWVQITDRLEEDIRVGVYAPGERIPSVMRLTEEYRVAMATARKALRGLRDRGLIVTLPHRGSYVKEPTPER
ncbi:winged helix-turn-helix domain-containing protein [Nocardiopsis alkaliphila]|uniref:winged helix-turn-helix domain-containing protein n=1 Tax=Nocardiopsis alkaliphila TaxID=225762 RepID=UPI00034C1C56|nr:winged helix-turn-helix domain-containing protein [Nocardiopsis alkaliphila]